MLIGALLRVPAQAIRRRIMSELNAVGFQELRLPHTALLQKSGTFALLLSASVPA
jgi:hypothetical protein